MVKGVMDKRETKEKALQFGSKDRIEVRLLGNWLKADADLQNRVERASDLKWEVRVDSIHRGCPRGGK